MCVFFGVSNACQILKMQTRSAKRKRNFKCFDEKTAQKRNPVKRKSTRPVWKFLDQEMKEPKDLPPPTTFNRLIDLEHRRRGEMVTALSSFLIAPLVDMVSCYCPPIPSRIDINLPMWREFMVESWKIAQRAKMNFLFHLSCWCRKTPTSVLHLYDFDVDAIFPSKYYMSLFDEPNRICIISRFIGDTFRVYLIRDPAVGYSLELVNDMTPSVPEDLPVVRHGDLFYVYRNGIAVTTATTFAEIVNFAMGRVETNS
jgi:hypothetical protein